MSSRSEGFMGDFGQESGGGPDADSRHAGQDRPKRVSEHQSLDFGGDLVALLAQGGELLGQARHDDRGSLRAGYDHRLLTQRLNDFGRQVLALREYLVQDADCDALFIVVEHRAQRRLMGLPAQFLAWLYSRLDTLGIVLPRITARQWRAAKQDWAVSNHGPVIAASLMGHSLGTAPRSYSNGTDAAHKAEMAAFLASVERTALKPGNDPAGSIKKIERFFALITDKAIRRGSFSSVKQLINRTDQFVSHYNENCNSFVWTASADSTLEKPHRLCSRISESHTA